MTTCPTCGQTLPEKLPLGLPVQLLGPVQQVILRAVHRGGANGILSTDLFDEIYNNTTDTPTTGPKVLHCHIYYINKKLKPHGLMIRSERNGRGQPGTYVLRRI